jgi:hypothetical protein
MPKSDLITNLSATLARHGMALRGGFAVTPADNLPDIAPGRPARSLVLVGNVGGAMWPAFAAAGPHDGPDPMDVWTQSVIDPCARAFGAAALYPFAGPPYSPFQRWAERAENVRPSPLMIYLHARYGLWHAYRAALLFAEDLDLPAREAADHPCDTCAGRPCLSTCPVGAFTGGGFDDLVCARHVDGPHGTECRDRGCLARRACPVGQKFQYPPAQMAFHMEAFLARRRGRV